MTHKINSECKVPENVLRQTIQRANNGHSVEVLIQSLAQYNLSEAQSQAIKEKLQQCVQKPDPLNAPELYNQLVEVINGNTVGATQTVVQTNTNIGAITIVNPHTADADQPCYSLNLVEDICVHIYSYLSESKDYVALAKSCVLMNKAFCVPELYKYFINMRTRELAMQLLNGFIQISETVNQEGKDYLIKQNSIIEDNAQLIKDMSCVIVETEEDRKNRLTIFQSRYGLNVKTTPTLEREKCKKIFSCAAAKLEKLHSSEFIIYTQERLKPFSVIIVDFSGQYPNIPIKRWINILFISICRDILFSFASQDLELATSKINFDQFVSDMKQLFLSYGMTDVDSLEHQLKSEIIGAIIKQHSTVPFEQLAEKLSDLTDGDFIGFMIHYGDVKTNTSHYLNHMPLDEINQELIDIFISRIHDAILQQFGFNIDINDVKRAVKNLILLRFNQNGEIQLLVDSLLELSENDIFPGELRERAEFLRSLL